MYVKLILTKSFGAKGVFGWCAPSVQPVIRWSLLYTIRIHKHTSFSFDIVFFHINPCKHFLVLFGFIKWFEISIKKNPTEHIRWYSKENIANIYIHVYINWEYYKLILCLHCLTTKKDVVTLWDIFIWVNQNIDRKFFFSKKKINFYSQ